MRYTSTRNDLVSVSASEAIAAGLYRGVAGDLHIFEDGSVTRPEESVAGDVVACVYIAENRLFVQTNGGVGVYIFDV